MNGIQILLITGIVIIFLYFFLRFRNALLDLLILVTFSVVGIFFILFPEKTNSIANRLGVGRGADLLFYSCIIFFLFLILKLFSRIRRLEEKLTDYVRQQAKSDASIIEKESTNGM